MSTSETDRPSESQAWPRIKNQSMGGGKPRKKFPRNKHRLPKTKMKNEGKEIHMGATVKIKFDVNYHF
jgi:hypothetical protein